MEVIHAACIAGVDWGDYVAEHVFDSGWTHASGRHA
jgi:hypothetical protein